MYRQFAMFTWALFIGLCMIGTLSGCGPTQTKTEKKLSRQDTVALIEELGPAVESAVALAALSGWHSAHAALYCARSCAGAIP